MSSVDTWLEENGVDPSTVSSDLRGLLSLCDHPEWEDKLRLAVLVADLMEISEAAEDD
jgi:hypothetical protein